MGDGWKEKGNADPQRHLGYGAKKRSRSCTWRFILGRWSLRACDATDWGFPFAYLDLIHTWRATIGFNLCCPTLTFSSLCSHTV